MRKKAFLLIQLLLIASNALYSENTIRAAFDFGSGQTKMQVAEVDLTNGKIVRSIYSHAIKVALAEDALRHPSGCYSTEIQDKALNAVRLLKEKAIALGAVEFAGVATEAYRKAPNAQYLLDRYMTEVGIPSKIISQEEEGRLGFWSVVAETNIDPNMIVAWDMGGASFQITYLDDAKNLKIYMAPFGRVTAKNAIIKFVKEENPLKVLSPNPLNDEEWERALALFLAELPPVPVELLAKLKRQETRLIGLAAHPEKLRILNSYGVDDILNLLEQRINKSDIELQPLHPTPMYAISELALVYSIMKKLQVSRTDYLNTQSGSTSAILLCEDYWQDRLLTTHS